MIGEYFNITIRNLFNRKLRSWLTMLGIFIGIAAVVGLVSLSQGLEFAIKTEFLKLGTDRINILPGGAIAGPLTAGFAGAVLTEEDIDQVKKVKGVDHSFGILFKGVPVTYKGQTKQVIIVGTPVDEDTLKYMDRTEFYDVEQGRKLDKGDTNKITIGGGLKKDYFKKSIQVGNKLKIQDQDFEVVGIQKRSGTGQTDLIARMPLKTVRDLFDEPDNVDLIIATLIPGADPSEVSEKIEKKLRRFRNVEEDKEDFTVQTPEQLLQTFGIVLNIVSVVLIGIAAISLIVGGISIMNTMYTSVLERTQEIGILKAIGARNSDILSLFLIESGLLGLVGGIIGILLGIGFAKSIEIIAAFALGTNLLQAHITPQLIIGALIFSFAIGALSGALPAYRASKLKPTESLM